MGKLVSLKLHVMSVFCKKKKEEEETEMWACRVNCPLGREKGCRRPPAAKSGMEFNWSQIFVVIVSFLVALVLNKLEEKNLEKSIE